MQKAWTDNAWEDYLYWQTEDKRTLKRINMILKDIDRQPFTGLGKPPPPFSLLTPVPPPVRRPGIFSVFLQIRQYRY